MTPEERAIYIAENLFDGRWVEETEEADRHYAIIASLWDDNGQYGIYTFLAISYENDSPWMTLVKWLSSPDGLHAIEQAMIESGYIIVTTHNSHAWDVSFASAESPLKWMGHRDASKAEAMLTATYMALKAGI